MLINVRDLKGMHIAATDGEIGKVADIYFDSEHWALRYFVVETGNWLLSKKVLVSPRAVQGVDLGGAHLKVALDREQVKHSPKIDTERPVSRQHEVAFNTYYGYAPYWSGGDLWGASPYPAMLPPLAETTTPAQGGDIFADADSGADPNLRSANEVIGYHIQATDDALGHVEDFLIDDRSWGIRYLVVDTRNWWPGKDVLVDAAAVSHVDWRKAEVHVALDRHAVENSPEYDADELPAVDYPRDHGATSARTYWRAHL